MTGKLIVSVTPQGAFLGRGAGRFEYLVLPVEYWVPLEGHTNFELGSQFLRQAAEARRWQGPFSPYARFLYPVSYTFYAYAPAPLIVVEGKAVGWDVEKAVGMAWDFRRSLEQFVEDALDVDELVYTWDGEPEATILTSDALRSGKATPLSARPPSGLCETLRLMATVAGMYRRIKKS